VFATVPQNFSYSALQPVMVFQEAEGTTLIVKKTVAEANNLKAEFESRMITLNVHSALDAIGFLARITTHLAALNMGVNPVSGFYHDHLFIPADRALDAMQALSELSASVQVKA